MSDFTIFRARKEDINFPCVWVKNDDNPDKSNVVCIHNNNNNKVYAQCRIIDDTLKKDDALQQNNKEDRYYKICNAKHPILISEHYRNILGINKNTIEDIELTYPKKYVKWLYYILTGFQHPEVYAKISITLGIISLILGVFSLGLYIVDLLLVVIILALLVWFFK